jgi:hypothetical protein
MLPSGRTYALVVLLTEIVIGKQSVNLAFYLISPFYQTVTSPKLGRKEYLFLVAKSNELASAG